MWDFLLVLGQIPGTHIQITFNEILGSIIIAVTVYMAFRLGYVTDLQISKNFKKFKRYEWVKVALRRQKRLATSAKTFSHLKVHARRAA